MATGQPARLAFAAKESGFLAGTLAGGWYPSVLLNTLFPYINKTGVTQFRLRFNRDDNADLNADYLKFYNGNARATCQPQLIISYGQP